MSRVFNMTEKSKRITEYLEDHIEVWRGDPEFMAKYKVVVDYIRNILKLRLDEDKILRVITSSYTNDFSQTLSNGNQAQLMFPLTAMMNHSCQPSISRWGKYIFQKPKNTLKICTNNKIFLNNPSQEHHRDRHQGEPGVQDEGGGGPQVILASEWSTI